MRRTLLLLSLASIAALGSAAAVAQQAPAPAAAATVDAPVDAAERKAVVEDLAGKLTDRFLFPDIGLKYAAVLRANLASGAYDQLSDPDFFAARITADLQAVAPDGHLRLRTAEGYGLGKPRTGAPAQPALKGLLEARMIGKVIYLSYDGFLGENDAVERTRRFLLDHSDAEAIIIDSRENHGGGLDEMSVILPLIYAKPAVLVRMDTRASVAADMPAFPGLVRKPSPATVVRYDHEVVPDKTETRLQDVPVYYLTSRRTASAAEHLALAFRHSKRAVQIGETTRGAGHFGGVVLIGERFASFIPLGRTYDPDTGWDWEGKGVAPDIAVPAEQALNEALKRAKAAGADVGQAQAS